MELDDTAPEGPRSDAVTEPARVLPGAPVAGGKIGRFTVERVLGRGAFGVVLEAHDPVLDRNVALKLLRPAAWGGGGSTGEARERLLREARAMAKLQHPNVLAVHEVGVVADEIFVAMELAGGGTLRAWLAAAPRPWREVLDRFLAAGRGLAAAHGAGLVHRDFKPENVLLTADGQVRVADFGLVGVSGDEVQLSSPDEPALTQAGTVLGTPAYMAPEQHLGEAAGPAADQFAFCVALWEGLYRQRPFAGKTLLQIQTSVLAGQVAPPPRGAVPAWLAAALRRGLSLEPARRWPSMPALLAVLEKPRRRLVMVAAAAALVVVAAGAVVVARRPPATQCRGFTQSAWTPARRAAVERAFLATGRPYAADTFARAARLLDARAAEWIAARGDACAATFVRGEQSPALLDRRMRCLDERLGELDALAQLFARADAATLDGATAAVARLHSLDRCADLASLGSAPAPPADAAAVMALERRLADADMLEADGRSAAALPLARKVVDDARAAGHPPTYAHALFTLGVLQEETGDARAAEATLRDCVEAARLAGDRPLAATAWITVLSVVSLDPTRAGEIPGVRSAAERAVEEADRTPHLVTLLDTALGNAAQAAARYDDAVRLHAEALALREKTLGPDDLDVALSLGNLALALDSQGKHGEAVARLERALAIREKVLGPDHPDVAVALTNLGGAIYGGGDLPRAEKTLARALAIVERSLGPEDAYVAEVAVSLGAVFQDEGRNDEAERVLRRALAIRERDLGKDDPKVAMVLNNLGNAVSGLGRYDEALALHRRALGIRLAKIGEAHPDTASSYNNVGDVLFSLERYADAADAYGRALAIWRQAFGAESAYAGIGLMNLAGVDDALGRPAAALAGYQQALAVLRKAAGDTHPLTATAMCGVAGAELKVGRARDALVLAERALALREPNASPVEVAEARFLVAQALWATGGDRRRALDLAARARAGFVTAGPAARKALAELDAFLKEHRR